MSPAAFLSSDIQCKFPHVINNQRKKTLECITLSKASSELILYLNFLCNVATKQPTQTNKETGGRPEQPHVMPVTALCPLPGTQQSQQNTQQGTRSCQHHGSAWDGGREEQLGRGDDARRGDLRARWLRGPCELRGEGTPASGFFLFLLSSPTLPGRSAVAGPGLTPCSRRSQGLLSCSFLTLQLQLLLPPFPAQTPRSPLRPSLCGHPTALPCPPSAPLFSFSSSSSPLPQDSGAGSRAAPGRRPWGCGGRGRAGDGIRAGSGSRKRPPGHAGSCRPGARGSRVVLLAPGACREL